MVFSPHLLDQLEAIAPTPWKGVVFRHMFAGRRPDAENTRGARWNPGGTPAIYLGTTREAALAEADYHISLQSPPPKARRTLYEIEVSLDNTLDLSVAALLADMGVGATELDDPQMAACQAVGGAAAWLGHDAIQVPSARSPATNLVSFPANRAVDARFEILGEQDIPA